MASESSSSSGAVVDWEANSENIRPTRRGRPAGALTASLGTSRRTVEKLVQDRFEEAMTCAEEGDDPLGPVLEWQSWLKRTYPQENSKLIYQLLWRFQEKYARHTEWIEDSRWLRIWEHLSDVACGQPHLVYQHAHQIGSLNGLADFYIRWSRIQEDRGEITEARRIFSKARAAGAKPLGDINSAEDEMEMREMRRNLQQQHDDTDNFGEDDDEFPHDENRVVFQRLQGLSTGDGSSHLITPIVRLPSVSGDSGSSRLIHPSSSIRATRFTSSTTPFLSRSRQTENSAQRVVSTPGLPQSNTGVDLFNILEDSNVSETAESAYLSHLFDMHDHIARLNLQENSRNRETLLSQNDQQQSSSTAKCGPRRGGDTFAVYTGDDEKENIDPECGTSAGARKADASKPAKQKWALRKCCIKEMSLEEYCAQRYDKTSE